MHQGLRRPLVWIEPAPGSIQYEKNPEFIREGG